MIARALAVEAPRKRGVTAGPALGGERGGPMGDQRGFPFAAQRDEGEDSGTVRLAALHLGPGVIEALGFGFAADQFGGGVFEDAGNVALGVIGRSGWRARGGRFQFRDFGPYFLDLLV